MKILIADDDEDIREMLRNMLLDFEVIEARNGREAVELVKEAKPDVIIMDILMPEMDGIEASKRILHENPGAVIICLTAFSGVKGHEMLAIGAREVISKPFRKNDLLCAVKRHAVNACSSRNLLDSCNLLINIDCDRNFIFKKMDFQNGIPDINGRLIL